IYDVNPLQNPEYMRALEEYDPALAQAHKEYASRVKMIAGVGSMKELGRLASKVSRAHTAKERQEAQIILREIRLRFIKCLQACDKYKDEYKEEALIEAARKADESIEKMLKMHYGRVLHLLEGRSEVTCIDDPAALLLRSADE